MSSDKVDRRRQIVPDVSVEEPRSLSPDLDESAETLNKPISRRRRSNNIDEDGPFVGLEKYVQKGFHPALIPEHDAQKYYDRDYEFCKDANGEVVKVRANLGKTASFHNYVLMEIRDDFYAEDLANQALRSKELLDQLTPEQAAMQRMLREQGSGFFDDLGAHKD